MLFPNLLLYIRDRIQMKDITKQMSPYLMFLSPLPYRIDTQGVNDKMKEVH